MSITKSLIDNVYLPYLQQHCEAAIVPIVRSTVARKCFLSAYEKLPPLSDMPEKEKVEMKTYINQLFKNETPQFRLDACKVVYTIGNLI